MFIFDLTPSGFGLHHDFAFYQPSTYALNMIPLELLKFLKIRLDNTIKYDPLDQIRSDGTAIASCSDITLRLYSVAFRRRVICCGRLIDDAASMSCFR